jgi:CTP:molybdopterin cytidylyltransferase MocA
VTVCALILAAGAGSRMGSPKQLLPLGGRLLLQHVVDAAAAAGLSDVVVVLGHAAGEVEAALVLPPGVRTVRNPRHAEGQATSLAAGLSAAPPGAAAALVLLGDQPEVRPDAIRALAAAHAPGGAPILRASSGGRPGHPVLIDRALWPEAMALRGDGGARALVARHPGSLRLVEVGGDPPEDVDTPEDHRRLTHRAERPPE